QRAVLARVQAHRVSQRRHQPFMFVQKRRLHLAFAKRQLRPVDLLVFVIVLPAGHEVGTIRRTVDRHLPFGAATKRADILPLGGAEALRFSLVADWTDHDVPEPKPPIIAWRPLEAATTHSPRHLAGSSGEQLSAPAAISDGRVLPSNVDQALAESAS